MLRQLLGAELCDEIVGNRPGAERDGDATGVRRLHEPSELQKALTLLSSVRERAAHEVDMANLRLIDHRIQSLTHALERRRRNFDLTNLLAKGRRTLVGRPVGAEAATHRDTVMLVQEILAARRDVDHQHVAMRGDAGLCERQAVMGLLRHPRP